MNTLYLPNSPLILELKNRIWKYTESIAFLTNEDCWNWLRDLTHNGYAVMSFLGKPFRVHRLTYWIYVDLCQSNVIFEPKIIIRHNCNNRSCINPNHLLDGTQLDNVKDRDDAGRNFNTNKTHCPFGHEFTEENTYIRPDGKGRDCKRCRRLREYNRLRLS